MTKSGTNGIVAAGHVLTVWAADEVLRAGGNAYDAALAAMAAACACEPVMASPGAAGYLLARPADGEPRVYDFFAQTPATCRPEGEVEFDGIIADFGEAQQEFHIGRGTVAVPGMIKGLFKVHQDLGRAPRADILAPAIALARDGVTITAYQAYLFDVVQACFSTTASCRAIFGSAAGDGLVKEGEVLRQPELADTLDALVHEGSDLFYRGEIAAQIVRDMTEAPGGHISAGDLAAYEVIVRAPLTLSHRGTVIRTNPEPASGGLMIALGLKLLDLHDVAALPFGSKEHVALMASAIRETGEARLDKLAVSDAAGRIDESILDPEFVEIYRRRIAGQPRAPRGTTQISVIDDAGSLASLTVSNGEGSGYVVPGTGIVMNNMLGEADLNVGGFHRWTPNARMTSMMAPTAVEWPADDGRWRRLVATGSGGSNRIRSAMLQVLVNLIDFQMPLADAVLAPRIHVEDDIVSLEGGFEPEQLQSVLASYSGLQNWPGRNMYFGGAHSVEACAGDAAVTLSGVGDPRRDGAV